MIQRRPPTGRSATAGSILPATSLTGGEESAILRQLGGRDAPDEAVNRYLTEHGLRHYTDYHPDSDFWTFQAIETTLYIALAVILLAATGWLVRRRTT